VRAAQPEDAEVLFAASAHPQFNRWLTWERPRNVAAIEDRFAQQLRTWHRGQWHCFSVVHRATGTVFAGADLKRDAFDRRAGTRNLGYWTHPEWQNQGLAREFVPAVVSCPSVVRLLAGAAPDNAPSHRILLGLGFTRFETRLVGKPGRLFKSVRYIKATPQHSA
jgi:RimJ/RimL family protein N-acetyltransferase